VTFVVDAHNDLVLELVHRRAEENPFARHWLDKLEQGRVGIQVCPIYGAFLGDLPESSLRRALEQVNALYRAARENEERVALVFDREGLEQARSRGVVGLLLALEGAEPLGYDPELVDIFWQLGVRMFSLTWNRRNPFAEGLAEPSGGGLSRLGQQLVDRLAAHGAILDLAHASERTFFDVLERTDDTTVVVSHASCRAVLETPRNLSDEQLKALADRDGVLGIMLHPLVVDPASPTIDRVLDHLDHAVEVMGVDHVGLGADFIRQVARATMLPTPPDALLPEGVPMDAAIVDVEGPEGYPNFVDALEGRGYSGSDLEAILGENFVRIFRRALPG
jgi:membrane dipeptidase